MKRLRPRRVRVLAAVVALATAAAAPRAISAEEFLYVHNTDSGEISKISIPEHEVVGEIEIGLYMDYLAASPDGRVLYVNRIIPLEGVAQNIGVSGELIAIDPRTDQIQWRLPIDGMPHHMSVSKDGRLVFVPLYDTWWLAVVDVEKRQVVKKILTGHGGHGTRLSPDGKRLYVGSMMYDQMWVIDTERLELIDRIPFREGVRPFVMTRDETRMYVQQSKLHGFEVINPRTKQHIATVKMPTLGREVQGMELYPHNVNHGLALSRDESLLLANGSALDVVSIFRHPGLDHIKSIPVGKDPNAIATSGDGRFAYVSCRGSDELSILDLQKLEEVKRLRLGKKPQRMVVIDVP